MQYNKNSYHCQEFCFQRNICRILDWSHTAAFGFFNFSTELQAHMQVGGFLSNKKIYKF